MISITKIRKSITGLLKEIKDIDVYYEDVEKTDSENNDFIIDEFFHVALIPITTNIFDENYNDKVFLVDISYVSKSPSNTLYYSCNEEMIATFLPYINIDDRYITIYSSEFKIVEQVGHFIFTIKFSDISYAYENKREEDVAEELDINFEEV